jgi:hypothetical protein
MFSAHSRLVCATVLTVFALPFATPALAQNPDQNFAYRQPRLRNACPPPLRFAAGACVRSCPAGYRYNGAYCRMSNGGW